MKAPFMKSALLIAGISLLVSCQKNVSELSSLDSKTKIEHPTSHPIKGQFTGMGQVISPDYWVNIYYYGEAEGWANGLGKFHTLFMSHMDTSKFVGITESSMFQDSLVKGKLWFLEDRLSELSGVSVFSYDKQGNSIWGKITYSEDHPLPEDPTHVNAVSKYDIVGGTGRYEGASGKYVIEGYFITPTLTEARPLSFTISGHVVYKDID